VTDRSPLREVTYLSMDPCRASLLYQILPHALQRRVPVLPSIRRSLSGDDVHVLDSSSRSSSDESRLETPPPEYSSRPSSGILHDVSKMEDTDSDSLLDNPPLPRPSSSQFRGRRISPEKDSGIDWKYASQGMVMYQATSAQQLTRVRPDSPQLFLPRNNLLPFLVS